MLSRVASAGADDTGGPLPVARRCTHRREAVQVFSDAPTIPEVSENGQPSHHQVPGPQVIALAERKEAQLQEHMRTEAVVTQLPVDRIGLVRQVLGQGQLVAVQGVQQVRLIRPNEVIERTLQLQAG
jgi:hypothetical protein